ncbi:MAG TPA: hypothetical protein VJ124_05465 [Pyrinomonadaceae bacterium]|nr:hypothetical protein [Pyrinomonadaceae bacterium]
MDGKRIEEIRKAAEAKKEYEAFDGTDLMELLTEVERLRGYVQYFIGVLGELDRFGLLGILDNLGGDADGVRFVVNVARRALAGEEP